MKLALLTSLTYPCNTPLPETLKNKISWDIFVIYIPTRKKKVNVKGCICANQTCLKIMYHSRFHHLNRFCFPSSKHGLI